MFQITNLTASGNQTSTIVLEDGSTVTLTFIYRPAVQRWTVDVTRGTFVAKGLGLTTHPNLLRPWRKIIPFGLQVTTKDGTDPFMADDLQSGRVIINMLDSSAGGTDLEDVEVANFQ